MSLRNTTAPEALEAPEPGSISTFPLFREVTSSVSDFLQHGRPDGGQSSFMEQEELVHQGCQG